jgi:hypothetical protein
MKEDQHRMSIKIVKSPLKDKPCGRMKEEAMSILQTRQGRKVKEEEKER